MQIFSLRFCRVLNPVAVVFTGTLPLSPLLSPTPSLPCFHAIGACSFCFTLYSLLFHYPMSLCFSKSLGETSLSTVELLSPTSLSSYMVVVLILSQGETSKFLLPFICYLWKHVYYLWHVFFFPF